MSPGSLKQTIQLDSRIELGESDHNARQAAEGNSEGASITASIGPTLHRTVANFFTSRSQRGPIRLQTGLSPKERALWLWANVEDLDMFLQDVLINAVRHAPLADSFASGLHVLRQKRVMVHPAHRFTRPAVSARPSRTC